MCHSCGQAWRNYNRYRQLLYTGFARFESIVNHILYYAGAHLATLQRHLKNCWHWKMCIHIIIYEWHHCERMANWRFVRVNVLCSALFADRSIVYVFGILYIFSIFVGAVFRMRCFFVFLFLLHSIFVFCFVGCARLHKFLPCDRSSPVAHLNANFIHEKFTQRIEWNEWQRHKPISATANTE